MIKQSFLNSLKGLPVDEAVEKVKADGHRYWLVPEDVIAIPLIAKPNTVVLWQEAGKITIAQAGDGVELEDV